LSEMKGYDVAGLSYSAILPIDQRFYFYECPSSYQVNSMREYAEKLIPAIEGRAKEGKIHHLIWKNPETKVFSEWADMGGYSRPIVCSILSNDKKTVERVLNTYNKLKLYRLFLIQKRGSASALIQLAVSLGYKRVIFVGVDLNGGGYFFENNPDYAKYNLAEPYSLEGATPAIHRTNDASLGIPIMDVMNIMFKNAPDMEFLVSSKNSELSSFLPLWKSNSVSVDLMQKNASLREAT